MHDGLLKTSSIGSLEPFVYFYLLDKIEKKRKKERKKGVGNI